MDCFQDHGSRAIPPQNVFPAFLHARADFVLAGMFDFEIAEDAKLCADAVDRNRKGNVWHYAGLPLTTASAKPRSRFDQEL
jgi:hypothetical protein